MEIKPISVVKHVLLGTHDYFMDSKKKMETLYNQMVEKDTQLEKELQGNVKLCFLGASDTAEEEVEKAANIINVAAKEIFNHSLEVINDDLEANEMAGGGRRR